MIACIAGTSWMVALRIMSLRGRKGEDELDLHAGVEREGVHADGRTHVPAGVAEELHEELAGGVGDGRLLGKARVAADERADAQDTGEAVQDVVAERPHGRQ